MWTFFWEKKKEMPKKSKPPHENFVGFVSSLNSLDDVTIDAAAHSHSPANNFPLSQRELMCCMGMQGAKKNQYLVWVGCVLRVIPLPEKTCARGVYTKIDWMIMDDNFLFRFKSYNRNRTWRSRHISRYVCWMLVWVWFWAIIFLNCVNKTAANCVVTRAFFENETNGLSSCSSRDSK